MTEASDQGGLEAAIARGIDDRQQAHGGVCAVYELLSCGHVTLRRTHYCATVEDKAPVWLSSITIVAEEGTPAAHIADDVLHALEAKARKVTVPGSAAGDCPPGRRT